MKNRSNIIIAAVVAVLAVITVVLAVGASFGSGGGGVSLGDNVGLQNNQSSQGAQAGDEDDIDYSPVSDAAKDMTVEEFEELLASSGGQSGSNARDASASKSVPGGADVYQELDKRGFGDAVVSADFDLNGKYRSSTGIEASTTKRYPSYTSFYSSASGVYWTIYVNDGDYFAVPLGASAQELSKTIILTETDRIVQYDGMKNEFSDFSLDQIPNTKCLKVKSIDRQTLDSYSIDALERM